MVRLGDTLTSIALAHGVSIEALMDANRLTDPDALSTGVMLVIPVGEGEGEPSIPTQIPDKTEEPHTPEPDALIPIVVIYSVEGAGDQETESVRLLNSGGEVSMAGWTIEDGEEQVYIFPAFTFYTTGAVDVHTLAGTDTSIDLYWGLDQSVWIPGKVITLRDASGNVQSTFQIPEN